MESSTWLYKDQSNAKKINTIFSYNVIFRKFIRLPYTAINPSNKSIRYSRYVTISTHDQLSQILNRPKRLTQHSMSITEGNALGNTFTLPPTIPEKPTQVKWVGFVALSLSSLRLRGLCHQSSTKVKTGRLLVVKTWKRVT